MITIGFETLPKANTSLATNNQLLGVPDHSPCLSLKDAILVDSQKFKKKKKRRGISGKTRRRSTTRLVIQNLLFFYFLLQRNSSAYNTRQARADASIFCKVPPHALCRHAKSSRVTMTQTDDSYWERYPSSSSLELLTLSEKQTEALRLRASPSLLHSWLKNVHRPLEL